MGGKPRLRGGENARAAAASVTPGRVVELLARLHLDEDEQPAAARHDIDLADRACDSAAPGCEIPRRSGEPRRGSRPKCRSGIDLASRPRRRAACRRARGRGHSASRRLLCEPAPVDTGGGGQTGHRRDHCNGVAHCAPRASRAAAHRGRRSPAPHRARRPDHDTPRRGAGRRRVVRAPAREAAAADLLVPLGQLARHCGIALAEPSAISASAAASRGPLEKESASPECAPARRWRPPPRPPSPAETGEQERVGRQTRQQRGQRRRGAGPAVTRDRPRCAARTSLKPGSETSGVPASRHQRTALAPRSRASAPAAPARHCGRDRASSGVAMPYRASSCAVTRVSSQGIRSTAASTSSARSVMSPRLPIGVATTCSPGASAGASMAWPLRT